MKTEKTGRTPERHGTYLLVAGAMQYESSGDPANIPDCVVVPITRDYAGELLARIRALREISAAGPLAGATSVTLDDQAGNYYHFRDIISLYDDDTLQGVADNIDEMCIPHELPYTGLDCRYLFLPPDTPLERLTPMGVNCREMEVSRSGVIWVAFPDPPEGEQGDMIDRMWTQLIDEFILADIAEGREPPQHLLIRRGEEYLPDEPPPQPRIEVDEDAPAS